MAKSEAILMNYAEANNDALLMKVACGKASVWEYLAEYVKKNDLAKLKINDASARTIGTSFENNKKRRKQLDKWIKDENKATSHTSVEKVILDLYVKEAELLDSYAYTILCDFLDIK